MKKMIFFIPLVLAVCCDLIGGAMLRQERQAPSSDVEKRIIQRQIYKGSKANKRYQECVAPGGSTGHCKHIRFCKLQASHFNSFKLIDYLCVIEGAHVGVCCPDDLDFGAMAVGSNIVEDLPADGYELEDLDVPKEKLGQSRGCGIGTRSFSNEVGDRTSTGSPKGWPWIVALIHREGIQYCGGVLITDKHVLTAAHCTDRRSARNIIARLGEYDFGSYTETRAIDIDVVEIRQHPEFDPTRLDNDISILRLAKSTTFNTYIWPICLPALGEEDFSGKTVYAAGWGNENYGAEYSAIVLMEVAMPVWDQKDCEKAFTQPITDKVLCAGAHEGGKDTCQGDSGGPLLYQLENGKWVTIGVVSWGINCGLPGKPGVYARVTGYLDWIYENTFA